MQKYMALFFFFFSISLFGQLDSVFSFQFDTTWNHSIMESDLILQVEVTNRVYITGGGMFECNVLEVVKGEFSGNKMGWNMSLMEMSTERWVKRFDAISPDWDTYKNKHYQAYVGFQFAKKNDHPDFVDKETGKKYVFFMSEKDLTEELKHYFFSRFLQEKLWPIYF